jgi:hypothetical protein
MEYGIIEWNGIPITQDDIDKLSTWYKGLSKEDHNSFYKWYWSQFSMFEAARELASQMSLLKPEDFSNSPSKIRDKFIITCVRARAFKNRHDDIVKELHDKGHHMSNLYDSYDYMDVKVAVMFSVAIIYESYMTKIIEGK